MAKRLGNFVIFVVLTILTVGLYPFYFYMTRVQEQNELLGDILAELKSQKT